MIALVVGVLLWQAGAGETGAQSQGAPRGLVIALLVSAVAAFFPALYWWALEPLRAVFEEVPLSLRTPFALAQLASVDAYWPQLILPLVGLVTLLAGRWFAPGALKEAD
jgi:hypothetical protein